MWTLSWELEGKCSYMCFEKILLQLGQFHGWQHCAQEKMGVWKQTGKENVLREGRLSGASCMCSLLADKPRHTVLLRGAIEEVYFWTLCQQNRCLPWAADVCLPPGPVNLINNSVFLFALAPRKPCNSTLILPLTPSQRHTLILPRSLYLWYPFSYLNFYK